VVAIDTLREVFISRPNGGGCGGGRPLHRPHNT